VDISLDLNAASASHRDLLLVSGDLVLTSDANPSGTHPILQSILQRLRMFRGEWFLNTSLGMPYYQQILIKRPNRAVVDLAIQSTILATPGVARLTNYSATFIQANRIASIAFRASTRAGTIAYDGPLNYAAGMVVQ
jgi:hypothetical protein